MAKKSKKKSKRAPLARFPLIDITQQVLDNDIINKAGHLLDVVTPLAEGAAGVISDIRAAIGTITHFLAVRKQP